jgi:hypothetical protein
MRIIDAVTNVDNLLPNAFDQEQKHKWLKNIEDKIYKEVVLTHENDTDILITDFEDDNSELIAPYPYDNLYISFILAKIFEYEHETVRYNNQMIIFNQEYQEFVNWYNRNNMPK